MNFKFYIFGESSGYKQYPDDSVSFRSFFRNQQSTSLLHIKRNADLVYYVYTQKNDNTAHSLLGFCLVFNGIYMENIKSVFALFEKAYSYCVQSGKLLKMNKTGSIDFAVEDLGSQKEEIDQIVNLFNVEMERNNRFLFTLLPEAYAVGQGTKSLTVNDTPETIAHAISLYDSISIPNNNSFKISPNEANIVLEFPKLEHDENKNNVKDWVWVLGLIFGLVVGGITAYFLL